MFVFHHVVFQEHVLCGWFQLKQKHLQIYNDVPLYDSDMLWPGAAPIPKLLDSVLVLVPFLVGFGTSIYKIWTVRALPSTGIGRPPCV